MNTPALKFKTQEKPEFFLEVSKKVNTYFKENNISKYANFNMNIKTFFMLNLYFLPLILMLTGVITSLWVIVIMWVLMGLGKSGIGLSIMHDANHGAYSTNKTVNSILGFLINFLGVYHINWKIQHNVLHHSFTNVNGYDEDITNPVMRLSPKQKHKNMFKYQAFYAPFIYGIMTLSWMVSKDFVSLIGYSKNGLLKRQKLTLTKAMFQMVFYKICYIGFMIILPLIFIDILWWQTILCFFMMHFITGLILALIFQPAHVLEGTSFFSANKNGSMENNWAIHQMKTTSNFANESRIFSWLIGGLNYQVEHHLFPTICHVHYRNISPIVKKVAKKYDIPYLEKKTFIGALKSHFTLISHLGVEKI